VTKVAVLGAAGRMGSTVCGAVEADADLELVARVDIGDSLEELVSAGAEVAVDFTTPDSVKANVEFCLDRGIHVVVGTTGLSDVDLSDIAERAAVSSANAFVAPNFALGAVLMMQIGRAHV
jgi:4-hydroxy-tetrahydrodipicolinate reductase